MTAVQYFCMAVVGREDDSTFPEEELVIGGGGDG
eukprot:CAMPEP_0206612728 /NCGR_PEP_ID=MMETSP0325_2-20121206/56192_1 /ASSEMBLY_ACC=CAM_ASM_000347 /TAXON_ID=2866 /ORGANISM="Crypthecodinium cohnii, Strain Seligo" /LENGTH=33 /DNA_ID= /DNA_START= /DNA_END= /DNA_ORIENTATION=